jgi:hypothetical protein
MRPLATEPRHRRRLLAAVLGVAVCAAALTACGSSGKSSQGSGSDPGVKLAECMRAHGVPNFHDPSAGGGIQIPNGVNPSSPAFQSAQRACRKLLPGGAPPRAPAPESVKLAMLKLAQCIRKHGFPTFPDPMSTPPAPGTGFGLAFGRPGAFIAVPQGMLQSPAFNQAAAKCGFPGLHPNAAAAG